MNVGTIIVDRTSCLTTMTPLPSMDFYHSQMKTMHIPSSSFSPRMKTTPYPSSIFHHTKYLLTIKFLLVIFSPRRMKRNKLYYPSRYFPLQHLQSEVVTPAVPRIICPWLAVNPVLTSRLVLVRCQCDRVVGPREFLRPIRRYRHHRLSCHIRTSVFATS